MNRMKINEYHYLNERKSEQAHIPHAPTLLENAVYNEWQFQALATGNRTKKGYKLLLKRIKSAFPVKNAYLHIMSFITTKFHEILLRCFRGVVLTRQTVVSFILAKFLSSKRA